jgi:PAS domain S-box-containing protein
MTGPGSQTIVLLPDLAELARARRFVCDVARNAGFGDARVYDITLLASEAAANAIEHAPVKGLVEIKALLYADRLELQVKGPGEFQTPDRLKEPRARGLGLPLMAKLSDHLALYSAPEGGTLLALTFYREGHNRPLSGSPLPPSLLELFETSDRLEAVFGAMPEGFAIFDHDLRCVYLNDAIALHYGRPKAELLGVSLPSIEHVEPQLLSLFNTAKSGGNETSREMHHPHRDRWSEVSVTHFAGGFAIFSRDITERKRVEDVLKETEARYDSEATYRAEAEQRLAEGQELFLAVLGCALAAIALYRGSDLTHQFVNVAFQALRPGRELLGKSVEEVWPELGEEIQGIFERVRETGEEGWSLISTGVETTGHERVLRDSDGSLLVAASEKRMAEAQRVGHIGSWEWNLDTGEILWSRELYTIYGVDPATFIPSMAAFGGYLHPEDRELVDDAVSRILANAGPVDFEFRIVRDDDTTRVLHTRAEVTALGSLGGPRLIVGVNLDVTEKKQTEEALRESEERYRILAQENERLYRQQLDIAEKLQVSLLNIPSEIGRVRVGHLYRSATEAARVGGDFYDVFEVKGGLVCVLVGDVAGHGIEAARTATLVKDVIHAFAYQSVRPQEVLRRTNALLVEKDLPGFVTLFLGILDSDTGEFRYASAGHPSTFLRRATGEIQLLGAGSAPLGIHPEASWKAGGVALEAGDLLLLYTDGVIEARRNGEFFGEKRLETLLKRKRISAERLPHVVLDQVLAFSGGSLSDDVAVLALSLTGARAPAQDKPGPA